MSHPISLLLVGCGKMGGALLERWKALPDIARIDIVDPNHTQKDAPDIAWHKSLDSLPAAYAPDVILLAVKPQQLDAILPQYRLRFTAGNPLYISIAAGKTLHYYTSMLGEHAHIVRAMPNTPALAGHGMTVLCAPSTLPASARKIAGDLLKAVGKTEWVEDESLMDAITALSGCGPAYVFLFLESMAGAAVKAGVPEDMAKTLALQTVAGSAALAAASPRTLEQLRIDVASPGGATEAALSILMKDNQLRELLAKAMQAAAKRSGELSK